MGEHLGPRCFAAKGFVNWNGSIFCCSIKRSRFEVAGSCFWVSLDALKCTCPSSPSKIERDRIPMDPVAIELLDTQVFSGSVKRGSCWRFLGSRVFSDMSP